MKTLSKLGALTVRCGDPKKYGECYCCTVVLPQKPPHHCSLVKEITKDESNHYSLSHCTQLHISERNSSLAGQASHLNCIV